MSLPSPEVTAVNCRVPLPGISQTPWYPLPAHLCRFAVRTQLLQRLAAFLVSMVPPDFRHQLSVFNAHAISLHTLPTALNRFPIPGSGLPSPPLRRSTTEV